MAVPSRGREKKGVSDFELDQEWFKKDLRVSINKKVIVPSPALDSTQLAPPGTAA